MMWAIASIPFWILGAIFTGVGFLVINGMKTGKYADESKGSLGAQMVIGFLLGGIFFLIAAKVAS